MPVNIVLDATSLDTFQSCPAKFNYRFNLNKVTTTKAKPLDRGTLVHNGEEAYFNCLKETRSHSDSIQALRDAVLGTGLESDLTEEEINRALEVLIESAFRWKERDLSFDIIAVEQSFSYLLHEDEDMRLVMIGKIDLLVNYEWNGQTYYNLPIDHKTYERDFPLKRTSNQFSNYSYACKSNYLFVNRIGFQKSIPAEVKHKFIPLSYDPLFHEQWKLNTIKIAKEYLLAASENSWIMNFTSCDKFNRICEYHEVCDTSGEDSKIYKLNLHFNTAPVWDVSEVLGKGKE